MPPDDPTPTDAPQQRELKQTRNQGSAPENRLREWREYEGMSQAKLGSLSNVSPDTISDAENRRKQPSRLVKNRLVRGFNDNPQKRDRNRVYRLEDIFP